MFNPKPSEFTVGTDIWEQIFKKPLIWVPKLELASFAKMQYTEVFKKLSCILLSWSGTPNFLYWEKEIIAKDLVCNWDVDDASSILFYILDILPDSEQAPLSLKQRSHP